MPREDVRPSEASHGRNRDQGMQPGDGRGRRDDSVSQESASSQDIQDLRARVAKMEDFLRSKYGYDPSAQTQTTTKTNAPAKTEVGALFRRLTPTKDW